MELTGKMLGTVGLCLSMWGYFFVVFRFGKVKIWFAPIVSMTGMGLVLFWGALAGAFLAPFLYGLYWKGVTRAGVWAGFIAGIGITVSNMFIGYIESSINAGAAAMAAGLIVVPAVSLLTPKPDKKRVDEIFACYDEKVTITRKRSLEQNS